MERKMIIEGPLWPFSGEMISAKDGRIVQLVYPVVYQAVVAKDGDWMKAEVDLGRNLVIWKDGSFQFESTDAGDRELVSRAIDFCVGLPRTAVITDAMDGVSYFLTREGEVQEEEIV